MTDTADYATMQAAAQRAQALVACVRCAAAAAHPNGHHPRVCPSCGRERGRWAA